MHEALKKLNLLLVIGLIALLLLGYTDPVLDPDEDDS